MAIQETLCFSPSEGRGEGGGDKCYVMEMCKLSDADGHNKAAAERGGNRILTVKLA